MAKRLYRSYENKMLGGICGGLAEYFDVDPSVMRILAVISLFVSGGMTILVYIVAWIIIPLSEPGPVATGKPKTEPVRMDEIPRVSPWTSYLPGLALIFFGSLLLIREHWLWFSWGDMWPIFLIALGLVLIFTGKRSLGKEQQISAENENTKAQNHGAVS
jgi:phage shock protein C